MTVRFTGASQNDLCDMIRRDELFSIARYSDGECMAILGQRIRTHGGQDTLPEVCQQLRDTLLCQPNWRVALYPHLAEIVRDAGNSRDPHWNKNYYRWIKPFDEWLTANHIDLVWDDAHVWNAHLALGLPLLDAILGKRIILVGPSHLSSVPVQRIEVPRYNAWQALDETADRLRNLRPDGAVILLCCGFLANTLIWRCDDLRRNNWLLDIGSVLDPFCGEYSRTNYLRDDHQKAIMQYADKLWSLGINPANA